VQHAPVFQTSCLSDPVGKENEIIIIISPEDKPHVERILGNLFSQIIYTPQPEPEFSLIYKDPWELDNVNKYGNILIASLDFPEDSTGDYLMERITQNHEKDALLIFPKIQPVIISWNELHKTMKKMHHFLY